MASLYATDLNNTAITRFPENIATDGIPYVVFAPYQRAAPTTTNTLLTNLPQPARRIVLPLPSSALATKYGVNYKDTSLGAIGAAIAGGGNLLGGLTASQTDIGNISTKVTDIIGSQAAFGVFGALGALPGGEQLVDAAQLTLGMKPNPYTEVLFENVPFREHTFTYVFHPKSLTESERLDDIVQYFKYYMLPAISGGATTVTTTGTFLRFPLEWQIIYSIGGTTFSVLPSVLTEMDVNYADGVDSPKLFQKTETDNKRYPTKINVTMTFKEVMLLNRDMIALNDPTQRLDGEIPTGDESVIKETQDNKNRYRF